MKNAAILLSALATVAMGEELCDQFAYFSDHGYNYNNNKWGDDGSGSGCTYIDSTTDGGVQWHASWSWGGDPNAVKQYPYGGREIEPKIVSQIGSLPTSASWSYNDGVSRANVAYDLFTASDPNHDKSFGDYELMVWLAAIGGVQPIGGSIGTVNVGGQDYDLHQGPGDRGMQVFSFVAAQQQNEFNTDIKEFFNVMADKGFPADSQYLITYQFGTEAFNGDGAEFTVNHWDANVA